MWGWIVRVRASGQQRGRGEPIQGRYARERAKGLTSTATLYAVVRKLARTCWSLVKHGMMYEATRVQQQPASRPARTTNEINETPPPLDNEP